MKASLRISLLFSIALAISHACFAQDTKPAAADASAAKWKPEDVVYTQSAGQFRISPDGRWAVWVKSETNKEKDGRVSNLFLSSLIEEKEIQLTRGTESHSAPRWSPDGQLIAFLSSRPRPEGKPDNARTQLWLISPFGGEPWPVTEFARGIRRYEWVTNDVIIFSAEEDATLYEQEVKKRKDNSIVVEDAPHTPPVRLFRLEVKNKKVTRLTSNDDWIGNWAITRDGRRAVTVHQRSLAYQWDQKIPPVTFLYDLTTGEHKQVFTEGRIRPSFVIWARDGSGFYAAAPYSTDPRFLTATIELLYFYDVASGKVTQVPLDWENGLSGGLEITEDGFVTQLAAGVRDPVALYTMSRAADGARSWKRAMVEGEHARNIGAIVVGEDGRTIVYAYSKPDVPTQWYRAQLSGTTISNPMKFTSINPQYKGKTLSKAEVIRWKGALDEEVEGVLYYPHDYKAGQRYPLVLSIHGGPTGVDQDAWSQSWGSPVNLLTQRGAFVLKVNYHGSGNYGLKWVESICCGKYYDLEVPDIEKGVDALIAQGKVDADRVGTMGWSNGAILSTAVVVANPARYKAASVGAGDVEWISDWANVDFGQAFDAYYFGKSPLEDPQLYIQKSPVFKMDRVRTPTLIFFGTEDRNVPTEQGWTHYRALYHLGQVPVRFILFPGEPHGPQKLTHQVRKVTEEMAWFDRYLFKTEKPANEAFKEDSPLGDAFRRKTISRVDGRYGVMQGPAAASKGAARGTLIPEVVKRGAIELGRFEVTRAQYATFDPKYKVAAGAENYPANGITLDQAKAYAVWLSKTTGQAWRLPNESEVSALLNHRDGENTLDYWAGYALNPDDAARLEKKVEELGSDAALLKEVGSFRGQGSESEELVFDLGGNVAEWVLAADGSGKPMGGSADRASDPKARSRAASAAYTGFRVVREAPVAEKK